MGVVYHCYLVTTLQRGSGRYDHGALLQFFQSPMIAFVILTSLSIPLSAGDVCFFLSTQNVLVIQYQM